MEKNTIFESNILEILKCISDTHELNKHTFQMLDAVESGPYEWMEEKVHVAPL